MGDYKLIDGFPGVHYGWVKPDTGDASQQFEDADYLNYETIATNLLQGPTNYTSQKFLFNLKGNLNIMLGEKKTCNFQRSFHLGGHRFGMRQPVCTKSKCICILDSNCKPLLK